MQKSKCLFIFSIVSCLFFETARAQHWKHADDSMVFDKLKSRHIAGAPILGKPILLKNIDGPVFGGGMGWAAPIFIDVNNDGLDDLLIGEFGSDRIGSSGGNALRVYENVGTKSAPEYSKEPYYLHHPMGIGFGTPISIFTWCCLPFTPRLADLDGDGRADLLSGQYDPGNVTWFKSIQTREGAGFDAAKIIPQKGINAHRRADNYSVPNSKADTSNFKYWYYSSADFVDLDGDGKSDVIFGGSMLRAALNTGTKTEPAFGIRTAIKDINGKFLEIYDRENFLDKKLLEKLDKEEMTGSMMVPYIVDWDNDGVEDLMVSGAYMAPGTYLLTFFKGVRKGKALHFEPGVPVFETAGIEKLIPGSNPNFCFTDWNKDGIMDVVIGTCVITNDERYDGNLSWQWELYTKTGKSNPGIYPKSYVAEIGKQMKRADSVLQARGIGYDEAIKSKQYHTPFGIYKNYYGDFGLEGIAHRGYVYVLLGENRK